LKKIITLSSTAIAALTICGTTITSFADSVSASQYDTTASVSFTAPDDNTTPANVTNPEAAGNQGPAGTAGALAIDYASNLDFGSHQISATDSTYYANSDSTAFSGSNVADFVEMHDLRGLGSANGNWALTITQKAQFNNGSSDLAGAQLHFDKATAKNANDGQYVPTATADYALTPGTAQTVMTGDGTVGQFLTSYGAASDYAGNNVGGPIALSVPSGSAAKGTYTSTLEWDLTSAP